jgi:hypothetical protein
MMRRNWWHRKEWRWCWQSFQQGLTLDIASLGYPTPAPGQTHLQCIHGTNIIGIRGHGLTPRTKGPFRHIFTGWENNKVRNTRHRLDGNSWQNLSYAKVWNSGVCWQRAVPGEAWTVNCGYPWSIYLLAPQQLPTPTPRPAAVLEISGCPAGPTETKGPCHLTIRVLCFGWCLQSAVVATPLPRMAFWVCKDQAALPPLV